MGLGYVMSAGISGWVREWVSEWVRDVCMSQQSQSDWGYYKQPIQLSLVNVNHVYENFIPILERQFLFFCKQMHFTKKEKSPKHWCLPKVFSDVHWALLSYSWNVSQNHYWNTHMKCGLLYENQRNVGRRLIWWGETLVLSFETDSLPSTYDS